MNTIKQHNHFLDQVRNYEEQLLKKKAETNLGLYSNQSDPLISILQQQRRTLRDYKPLKTKTFDIEKNL